MEQDRRVNDGGIAVSSRIRLARNLKGVPFPSRMDPELEAFVVEKMWNVIAGSSEEIAKSFQLIRFKEVNPLDRQVLVEQHLISPELGNKKRDSAAIISRDNTISIMLNEEDHARIQCFHRGSGLDKAWALCRRLDELFEEKMDFAYDRELGYLTCCPTNAGTGMRASIMLHLPALAVSGYIKGILDACSKLGIAIRGMYGENSEALGGMFQVSNQVTLGQSEEEIIAGVNNISSQIIEQEKMLRTEMYNQNPYRFEDRIYRSFGVLSNARIISTEESLKLISDVRLGVGMGIIGGIDIETLNDLLLIIQPAYLQQSAQKQLEHEEMGILRAELIRGKLKETE